MPDVWFGDSIGGYALPPYPNVGTKPTSYSTLFQSYLKDISCIIQVGRALRLVCKAPLVQPLPLVTSMAHDVHGSRKRKEQRRG